MSKNRKEKDKKEFKNKIVESFNTATKEQKEDFINSLEKALNFDTKKK